MHYSQLLVASLLGVAAAAPIAGDWEESWNDGEADWECKGKEELATFDDLSGDLTTIDEINLEPITAKPIGVYDGLNYGGLFVLQGSLLDLTVGGVAPESQPNVAASDTGLLGDMGTVEDYGYPNISVEDTTTKFFDLKSFYFGCDLDSDESIASDAEDCDLAVTGITWEGKEVTANFSFVAGLLPDNVIDDKMVLATLPEDFVGLTSVQIKYAPPPDSLLSTVTELTGLLFLSDNYDYVIYTEEYCHKEEPKPSPPAYTPAAPPAYTTPASTPSPYSS